MSPNRPLGLVLAALLALPSAPAAAAQVSLDDGIDRRHLDPLVEVLEDPGGQLELADVLRAQGFAPSDSGTLNFGQTRSTYWVRFGVERAASSRSTWLLEVGYPHLDVVDLFLVDGGRPVAVRESGDTRPFATRDIDHRNFVFRLLLAAGEQRDVYLRVRTEGQLRIPLTLWTPEALVSADRIEHAVFWLSYGICLVMVLYNLFIFFALRDRSYLYYVLYIGAMGAFFMCQNGVAYELLWPGWPWWANQATQIFLSFGILGAIAFSRTFLALSEYVRWVDRALLVMGALVVVGALLSLLGWRSLLIIINLVAVITFAALVLPSAVLVLRRGFSPARWFVIAWSLLLLSAFITALQALGVVAGSLPAVHAAQIGTAVEAVVLALALADRINRLEQDKKAAQRAAHLELQRTTTAYSRFVPHEFLELLGKESICDIALGDQSQQRMTVMFADIRDFTTLSERLTPAENFRFLNSYLTRIAPAIEQNGGFIDKYIGDGIMALFADRADDAVHAAVAMQRALAEYNGHRQSSGYPPVAVGIGLHTGDLILGTIGVEERMESTVISASVNLGARIERFTRRFGVAILVSDETVAALAAPDSFQLRHLGRVRLRAQEEEVSVHEVFGADPPAVAHIKAATRSDFERGVERFLAGHHGEARAAFEAVLARHPEDPAAAYYLAQLPAASSPTASSEVRSGGAT